MGPALDYACLDCKGKLERRENGTHNDLYDCPDCGKAFERKRSDRKWSLRPVKSKTKPKGATAPRPYYNGLLWE